MCMQGTSERIILEVGQGCECWGPRVQVGARGAGGAGGGELRINNEWINQ